jgi:hypothetical protein
MPNDFRYCFMGCCRIVDSKPMNRAEYEAVVGRETLQSSPQGLTEHLIPCRVEAGSVQHAAEAITGFYLGAGLRRVFGMPVADGKLPRVYSATTGRLLRDATTGDVQAWNIAWKTAVANEIERRGIS